jgi:hypothetical protein
MVIEVDGMGKEYKGPEQGNGRDRDDVTGRTKAKDEPVQITTQKPISGNPLSRELQTQLGQQVRALFDEVVQEPMPNRLRALLNDLRQKTSNR